MKKIYEKCEATISEAFAEDVIMNSFTSDWDEYENSDSVSYGA